jgi:hypothetical protein
MTMLVHFALHHRSVEYCVKYVHMYRLRLLRLEITGREIESHQGVQGSF